MGGMVNRINNTMTQEEKIKIVRNNKQYREVTNSKRDRFLLELCDFYVADCASDDTRAIHYYDDFYLYYDRESDSVHCDCHSQSMSLIDYIWKYVVTKEEICDFYSTELNREMEEVYKGLQSKSFDTHPDRNIRNEEWNKGFVSADATPVRVVRLSDLKSLLDDTNEDD